MFPYRIGVGHDTHRLEPGGSLRIGGVDIPFDHHLVGHSDADVLLHAVTDALLGGAGLGDIGDHFPNTDEKNRGRDSGEMLQIAAGHVRAAGFEIANIDCIVFAQKPKLGPHKRQIAERIAALLGLSPEQIGVKGKTGEHVGPVGRQEAMMAEAVVLLVNTKLDFTSPLQLASCNHTKSSSVKTVDMELKVNPNLDRIPKSIRVYSTLSKEKVPLETVHPGKVGIYLCGPTVYKEAHIGHMVGPVIFDTIARYLSYSGFQTTFVVNITDVDDKLIGESNKRGIPMSQVATQMTADYCANLLEVGVDQITHMPRATEHMIEIIQFIETLIEKDFAYAVDGDVFFDVMKDREYGKLTNRRPDEQEGGGGIAAARKRSPGDFALWKSAKPGEPSWPSPWGHGRPGWHIECSAMSKRILGETFDIHGGGLDLTFPHHENEIAQSECCHGKPMAKYWLHNGLMRASSAAGKVGGKSDRDGGTAGEEQATVDTKISRSKGAGGLRDFLAKHGGERVRFFLLRTHYRSTIVFSDEAVNEAGAALEKFYTLFDRYKRITGIPFYLQPENETRVQFQHRWEGAYPSTVTGVLKEVSDLRESFLSKMDDDFNTGGASSDLFVLLNLLNRFIDENKLEEGKADPQKVADFQRAMETLRELGGILGLFLKPRRQAGGAGYYEVLDKVVNLLIRMRADARVNKDFALADRIRNELTAAGVTLEDRKDGTAWRAG